MTTGTAKPDPAPELPLRYRRAAARWGEPVGIEEARLRWAQLVAAAEAGTVTLIQHSDRGNWVVLIPLDHLATPVEALPVWSLREARPKLGELVAAAHGNWKLGERPAPQVLTRHRRPVAALMHAMDLEARTDRGDRLDVDAVLRNGATITLTYHPDQPGRVGEHGTVVVEPEPGGFMAVVRDERDADAGFGYGTTAIEALLGLYQPRGASTLPAELYDSEAPF